MSRIAPFLTKPIPRDDLPLSVGVIEDINESLSVIINDIRSAIQNIDGSGGEAGDVLFNNGTDFVPTPVSEAIWSPVPTSATDPGTAGQIAYDNDFFYVCIATNTWRRTALAVW